MDIQNWIDKTAAVRQGEELDAEKLATYLRQHIPDLEPSAALEIEQFPSGHSNLTYLLRVGQQEMVLRRPPFGAKIKTAHDMGREYKILLHLAAVYSKVPRVLAYCQDPAVLGAPFYVMERLKGIVLRASAPKGLDLTPALMRQRAENFLSNLVEIHGVDCQAVGLGDLGRPAGYVRRQIEGWTQRYASFCLETRVGRVSRLQWYHGQQITSGGNHAHHGLPARGYVRAVAGVSRHLC
jgi:aminoglycoside phosphotransferase (APT) family kinase protein